MEEEVGPQEKMAPLAARTTARPLFPSRFLEINSEKQLVLRKAEVAARKGANFAAKRGPGHRPEGDKMLIETAKELREVAGQHPLDAVALAKATTRRQLRKYQRQVEVGGCLAGSVAAWLPSKEPGNSAVIIRRPRRWLDAAYPGRGHWPPARAACRRLKRRPN